MTLAGIACGVKQTVVGCPNTLVTETPHPAVTETPHPAVTETHTRRSANATRPQFVIPSAVEGSALRLSPSTNFYTSPCIGYAEEPFFQQQCRRVTPGSEAAAIETHVPLPIRCWSSVKICGRRKAQSRSLDCARDDKRGGGMTSWGRDDKRGLGMAAIETHVPLPIRCWSSVEICGGRKAQSRSLDCARDDKRGGSG